MSLALGAIGRPIERVDGPLKVTGGATYAYEYATRDVAYVVAVQSTIAKGRVVAIDESEATALAGVDLVITPQNAVALVDIDDGELRVLQSSSVAYHGQIVAAVVAETYEIARHAAALVRVSYESQPHDVALSTTRPDLYAPDHVNPSFATDTHEGDVDGAIASAAFSIDATYETPYVHNQPLEPHATIAEWTDENALLVHDANQGAHAIRKDLAALFSLEPERVRVRSPYIGGGFGSKAFTHPHVVLAVMAAKLVGRPAKIALTRQQMFSLVGHRTPTIQRVRLATDADGKLVALAHDVVEQTSQLEEFAEQTALASRMMYATPNRQTTHRLAKLDVSTPSIMRAPGECPGMFGLESAMDEMAYACGLDPIDFRVRNEPARDPETGNPWSSRGLVACLRQGAARFGWSGRDPKPGLRRDGRFLVGTGVAAATYPTRRRGPCTTEVTVSREGPYRVAIDASDIGTGTWTTLAQIAADAFEVPFERIALSIGDSDLPEAPGAGGSMGLASWGSAVVAAAAAFRARRDGEFGGTIPAEGFTVRGAFEPDGREKTYAMHAFGAQFAEVRVDVDTGEIRVPRLLGIFGVGRVVNPRTGRSQLLGGMTMGVSMALHEETTIDPAFGHFANHDFAEYHIAVNADVPSIEVDWIDESDPHVNPMGAKGIGEIGIVGTAAAIANAAYHATGVRVRRLPLRSEAFLR